MGFRYIGSKEKLAEKIIEKIKIINPKANHIIDLMAGTGQFSVALRQANFQVSAADVMTYSYHHLSVGLLLNDAPLFEKISNIPIVAQYKSSQSLEINDNYATILSYLNELSPIKGYFHKEFSIEGIPSNTTKPRNYFTSSNAAKIDAIRLEIKRLKKEGIITAIEHSLLLHDLIMALNDIANIAGTYGHYLSTLVARAKTPILLQKSKFADNNNIKNHTILRGYAEELAPTLTADLCYIDPPYIKRQYAANYHILETIAREDEPEAIGDSGLRPWRDQYSDFCSKVKIRNSFDKILTQVNCKDFLVSYSEDGLIPIDDLLNFLSKYGKVTKKDIEYKRFKSNNSLKNPILKEFLIHIIKD
jgi:adenine-specific DNA-methyltransferase